MWTTNSRRFMMQQLRAGNLSALNALATLTALASSPPRAFPVAHTHTNSSVGGG